MRIRRENAATDRRCSLGPCARQPHPQDNRCLDAHEGLDYGVCVGQGNAHPGLNYPVVIALLLLALIALLPAVTLAAGGTGVIEGKLVNGTAGGALPGQVPLELYVYKGMDAPETRQAVSDAQGAFRFEGLETGADYSYELVARYKNVAFASDMVSLADKPSPLTLSVYEPTTDMSGLSVQRAHVILQVTPRALQVGQLFVFSNPGDRAVVGGDGSGAVPTLSFPLPTGASGLGFQDGEIGGRYLSTPGGFADTWPVLPGQGSHSVLFHYTVAFDGPSATLSITAPYTTTALNVLISDPAVKVTSADLQSDGIRNMQDQAWQSLSADSVPAGKVLAIKLDNLPLEARPGAGSMPATATVAGSRNLTLPPEHFILFGILAFGLGIVAGRLLPAIWGRSTPEGRAEPAGKAREMPESEDDLIVALADLDDAHDRGEIADEAYRTERERLKREIAAAGKRK